MEEKLISLTELHCKWLKYNCEPMQESEMIRKALDFYIESNPPQIFKQEYMCYWANNKEEK